MRILKKNIFAYIHICVYITESLCCTLETQHCKPTVIFFKKDTCTSMFIAVLFTVGKAGNICINIPVIRSCGYQKEGDINNSMLTAASCWYVAKTNTRSQSNYPPIKNILKILSIFF